MAVASEFGATVGQEEGVLVWRIEKLKPVLVPKEEHGAFYSGDAYIVLHTVQVGREYDLYFWLGDECSVDERGAAAYRTVELDQQLGNIPVQYRECQGSESRRFASLWTHCGGLQYLEGGVESAFNSVTAGEGVQLRTRLLHIKGRRTVRVREVKMERASLNAGDVFLLDEGTKGLYLWAGPEANRYEKVAGGELMSKLKADRSGRPKAVLLNEEPAEMENFWSLLGGEGPIASAEEGGSDEVFDKATEMKMYKLDDGGFEVVPEVQAPFKRDLMTSDNCYLLDDGGDVEGIHLWVGNNVSNEAKKQLNSKLETYLGGRKCPVARHHEGNEDPVFKSFFMMPFDPPQQMKFGYEAPVDAPVQTGAEAVRYTMVVTGDHRKSRRATNVEFMLDRLKEGAKVGPIWRIENFEKVEIPEEKHGQFYDGDAYIVQYTYKPPTGREQAVVYFWQGCHAEIDKRGASALLAQQHAEETFFGRATQVRVVMNKEPSHFLVLFKGRMVVHHGGVESGFRRVREAGNAMAKTASTVSTACTVDDLEETPSNRRLYHVRGRSTVDTKALQVPCQASSLNSNDVFILVEDGEGIWIWQGKGASEDEVAVAEDMAELMEPDLTTEIVEEGEEEEEFWERLGGEGEYAKSPAMADPDFQPRLFQISSTTGNLRVDEIFRFSQEDLFGEDVMLLDTYDTVFLWEGAGANAFEKQEAPKVAQRYIEKAASRDGRDEETPVVIVKAGLEPIMFTCHFHGWDPKRAMASFTDIYDEKMQCFRDERERRKEEEAAALEQKAAEFSAKWKRPTVARAQKIAELEHDKKKDEGSWWKGTLKAVGLGSLQEDEEEDEDEQDGEEGEHCNIEAKISRAKTEPLSKEVVYSYAELKGGQKLPGVDPTRKEQHLSDTEFQDVFKMSKDEFSQLPAWKQSMHRAKTNLF